jgi:hypothetical protein
METAVCPHGPNNEWTDSRQGRPPRQVRPLKVEHSLYNLSADPSETTDVSAQHPEIVKRLEVLAESMRSDLGDDLTKRPATGARPPGVRR